MAQLIWTEPALQELNEIAEYIALDNISAVKKLINKVLNQQTAWLNFQSWVINRPSFKIHAIWS